MSYNCKLSDPNKFLHQLLKNWQILSDLLDNYRFALWYCDWNCNSSIIEEISNRNLDNLTMDRNLNNLTMDLLNVMRTLE